MTVETICIILGAIISFLGVWIVFILNDIKKSQKDTNTEIKEMTNDIRNVLVSLGKNDEKIINLADRMNEIHEVVVKLDTRVLILEQKKLYANKTKLVSGSYITIWNASSLVL